jgi:Ion channel
MVSVLRMLYRFAGAVRRAAKEETFVAVVGAAIALVLSGTVVYTLGEGWNVVDGFYFAVCTLTTSSIADPNLTLTHEALKIFTALYVLTGIGILVELARQLGVGFVKMREEHKGTTHTKREDVRDRHHKDDPPKTSSAG